MIVYILYYLLRVKYVETDECYIVSLLKDVVSGIKRRISFHFTKNQYKTL